MILQKLNFSLLEIYCKIEILKKTLKTGGHIMSLALKEGLTYSSLGSNGPDLKIIEIFSSKIDGVKVYKVLIKNHQVHDNLHTPELELLIPDHKKSSTDFVEHLFEEKDVREWCYRIYDPNVKLVPYLGKITKEDIDRVQVFIKEPISEQIIRDAITSGNWGGDWSNLIENLGIANDTCNRGYVIQNLIDSFGFNRTNDSELYVEMTTGMIQRSSKVLEPR